MKSWLNNCRILVMCLAAVLLLGTVCPVLAAPADTKTPTLTIKLKESVFEAEFAVYRVSDYVNGQYVLLPAFELSGAKLNEMKTSADVDATIAKLRSWMGSYNAANPDDKITPDYQGCTEDGELAFGEVPMGMYLIVQVGHDDDRLDVSPSLVGVPHWETETNAEGEETKLLVYDVVVKLKFEVIPEETEPETETETSPPPTEPESETPPPPTEPETPPPPSEPEPPEPEWVEEIPGVLGAMRGVLGAVRTGDLSGLMIAFYVALMAAAVGGVAFVIARHKHGDNEVSDE